MANLRNSKRHLNICASPRYFAGELMMRRPNQRLQIRLENHARPLANGLPAHLIINSDLDVWRVANRLCQRRPRSDTNAFEVINGNRSFANWISALVPIGA